VLFADHSERLAVLSEALAAQAPEEPMVAAARRAAPENVEHVFLADPALFLARQKLAAAVPAARGRGVELDAEYEQVMAHAVAEALDTDAETDLRARLAARSVLGAVRAAIDVWVASGVSRWSRHIERCGRPLEKLRAGEVSGPLLILLRRPAALADQQLPDVGVFDRPEDVGGAVHVEPRP
jgi:MftR C-terminal domain